MDISTGWHAVKAIGSKILLFFVRPSHKVTRLCSGDFHKLNCCVTLTHFAVVVRGEGGLIKVKGYRVDIM